MLQNSLDELRVCQLSVEWKDPHIWSDDRDRLSIRSAVYESLVRYDAAGRYRPALAERWHVANDARTWTFALRSDVSFHNGKPLDAEDVVTSLDRARGSGIAGELGTDGLYRGYLGSAEMQALDRRTVQVVTGTPMADLLDLLVEIPIVSGEELAGTGPYQRIETGTDQLVMERHAAYWGYPPAARRVRWQAERDPRARIDALLSGKADIVSEVNPAGARQIETRPGHRVQVKDGKVCVIFMCNASQGVCGDRRMRQALNYALDRAQIIGEIKGGAARPLNGPLTPLHYGHDPATAPYPHDPAKARALLAAAGCGDGLSLVVDIPTTHPDEAPRLAVLMAEQYAAVGINTEIATFGDRPAYAEMVKAKRIDDLCCFDSSPLSTWRVLREKFHAGVRGAWWQGYSNPEVDALLDLAAATVDDAGRQALYRRAYRLIRDDAPWVFLYSPSLGWGLGPRAAALEPGVDGALRLP